MGERQVVTVNFGDSPPKDEELQKLTKVPRITSQPPPKRSSDDNLIQSQQNPQHSQSQRNSGLKGSQSGGWHQATPTRRKSSNLSKASNHRFEQSTLKPNRRIEETSEDSSTTDSEDEEEFLLRSASKHDSMSRKSKHASVKRPVPAKALPITPDHNAFKLNQQTMPSLHNKKRYDDSNNNFSSPLSPRAVIHRSDANSNSDAPTTPHMELDVTTVVPVFDSARQGHLINPRPVMFVPFYSLIIQTSPKLEAWPNLSATSSIIKIRASPYHSIKDVVILASLRFSLLNAHNGQASPTQVSPRESGMSVPDTGSFCIVWKGKILNPALSLYEMSNFEASESLVLDRGSFQEESSITNDTNQFTGITQYQVINFCDTDSSDRSVVNVHSFKVENNKIVSQFQEIMKAHFKIQEINQIMVVVPAMVRDSGETRDKTIVLDPRRKLGEYPFCSSENSMMIELHPIYKQFLVETPICFAKPAKQATASPLISRGTVAPTPKTPSGRAGITIAPATTRQPNNAKNNKPNQQKPSAPKEELQVITRAMEKYKCGENMSVGQLIDMIQINHRINSAQEILSPDKWLKQSGFEVRIGGREMSLQRTLWSYAGDNKGERTIKITRPYQTIVVFAEGKEVGIDVDFSEPVETVINQISERLNLGEDNIKQVKLMTTAGGILKRKSSLRDQNILGASTLLLKHTAVKPLPESNNNFQANSVTLPAKPLPAQPKPVVKIVEPTPTKAIEDDKKESIKKKQGKERCPGDDMNIWDEPQGEAYSRLPDKAAADYRYQEDTPIIAGTINKIVEMLTSPTSQMKFTKAVLMTYLSFTNPKTLLSKLIERYNFRRAPEEGRTIQVRVCNVMKHWITSYPHDFDHDLTQEVTAFIDERLAKDEYHHLSSQVRSALLKRTCGLKTDSKKTTVAAKVKVVQNSSKTRTKTAASNGNAEDEEDQNRPGYTTIRAAVLKVASVPNSPNMFVANSLFDFEDEEIANQLTLKEFMSFSEIRVTELLDQAWNKPDLIHQSPNVLKMIDQFNKTSRWIAGLILEPTKPKERAKRLEKIVNVAEHLLRLNNYQTTMSIIGGLNSASVLRMKILRAQSGKALEKLQMIEQTMNSELSYKTYRGQIKHAAPPVLPFIGVHLSDLIFIEDGNPNFLMGQGGRELINWEKRAMTYRVIAEVTGYQGEGYNLKYNSLLSGFINHLSPPSDKDLFNMSLLREPRKAAK